MTRRGIAAALILITAAALALRLPRLDNRPFHGDEAVHAFKFRDIWDRGIYRYDPNEYHGPTLYYAAIPAVNLNGRRTFAETQESDYRLAPAVIGGVMVLLLGLLRDGLGGRALLWAGLLLAFSPAFVFYSRYFIQEVLLACFTLGALACAWRWRQSARAAWALLTGGFIGLMIATKETAPFALGAAAIAWPLTMRRGEEQRRGPGGGARATVCALTALAVAYLFLSGFLSYPPGPLAYFESYLPWMRRASSTDLHNQPWHHYLSLLGWTHRARGPVWSEALILGLAAVGVLVAFLRGGRWPEGARDFTRFTALTTLLLAALYSAIPYKTPWLVLSFHLGFILMAGVGASALLYAMPGPAPTAILGVLLLAGAAQLGWQAYRTSFLYPTDGRNPYAYAQPVPDAEKLGARVVELSRYHPDGNRMVVKVFAADEYYWPLPWHLRALENVGYWTELPKDVAAPVVLSAPEYDEELTKRLDATHLMTGFYGLRPAVLFQVWVRMDLWERYLKLRPKPSRG